MRDVTAGVDSDNWQFGRVYLLEDLRVGDIGAATSFEVAVVILLFWWFWSVLLGCNFLLARHINFDFGVISEGVRERKLETVEPDVEI